MSVASFDVRFWKTERYAKKNGSTTYRVRWTVAGNRFGESLPNAKLAESFRASLVAAARQGEAFSTTTGLPLTMERGHAPPPITWFRHAMDFVDLKWDDVSPKHRKST